MKEDIFINTRKELLTNEKLYDNSKRLMEQMEYEDGVANAIKLMKTD
ncbi:MAG: hypothetical protein ABIR66_11780 [Saprospiraceae bacterium]